ncbi:hypothetical protein PR048_010266 [Dryococelus australis]|uniref:HTH CENPB-type domain-containing protein n=1 Tax=Dryococelus australis TaxID=614101 RepID=A0ABQ9I2D9_9NEOP|nr:hypothetical protein PR048_010266 [Dryococelus australis]
MAGKNWAYRFIQTHNLALITPQKMTLGRIMGFNKNQVKVFFENLSLCYEKYKFPPRFLIWTKGKKLVGNVSSGERGENITVVCSMSASGIFVPPAIIFACKRMRSELLH